MFTLSFDFHYGGKFVNDPNPSYKGEHVSFALRVDPDELFLIELTHYTKDLGYAVVEGVYHRKRGHENEDFRKKWKCRVENVNANGKNVEFHEEKVQYDGVEANVDLNVASSVRVEDNISVNATTSVRVEDNISVNPTNIEVENDDNVLNEADISEEEEEEDNSTGDSDSEDSICEGLYANPVEGSDEDEELRATREKVRQYKRRKS
ncbi:hypothetical protein GH714_026892 [Hevea brasiliensis]|uniref:PB1-like domain-containing protein n=1 Tax=Hevea brasiliensis TaxID=3981 RepID=A0A6A6LFI7_HEVBR|nr:hypothetical protein GH714_026892 [Hevea brasiliensis]